jgi:hypothetical protein
MCCALCLLHDDDEKAGVLACTFLDRFCRVWPGDTNISQLDGPHLTKIMEARYECAEAALKRELQNIAICENLEAIKKDLKESIGIILERGEKLEDLVATSGTLSEKSKEFYVKVGDNGVLPSGRY